MATFYKKMAGQQQQKQQQQLRCPQQQGFTLRCCASLVASRCEKFHTRRHLRCDIWPASVCRISIVTSRLLRLHIPQPVSRPSTRPQTPVTPDLATSESFPHRSQKAVISPCCPQASVGHTSRPRLKAQETSKSFAGSGGRVWGCGSKNRNGALGCCLGQALRLQHGRPFV